MDSFIYSINSTVPIFLVMILGWVIKQLGIIDDNFASKANKYVFKVALPVLLFRDLAAADFKSQFDAKFVWTLEKNEDAIRFYEAHGFKLNGKRQLEEGTPEYIVMLERD